MTSDDRPTIEGPVTDPAVVRALTTALLETYDDFINGFDGEITYAEGMMAAHNFHVYVIEHLVHETGDDIWRNGALATFARRMREPGEFDTKVGPS